MLTLFSVSVGPIRGQFRMLFLHMKILVRFTGFSLYSQILYLMKYIIVTTDQYCFFFYVLYIVVLTFIAKCLCACHCVLLNAFTH